MNAVTGFDVSRRALLAGGGALVVSFALAPSLGLAQAGAEEAELPQEFGSLADFPMLDSWIRIDESGAVLLFTGKAELGQGIKTAFIQICAEELEVAPQAITLFTADTGQTPDEGFTAASHSLEESGRAIFNAAAQVRTVLVGWAAERLGVPASELRAENGAVIAADGTSLAYAELVRGRSLHIRAEKDSYISSPETFTIIGTSMPRVDIPAKVTGGVAYVQDLRLDGMLHARVVRPPTYGATLARLDSSAAEALPGVVQIVRNGSFLAVVAEKEYQAIRAMNVLAAGAEWSGGTQLPDPARLYETLRGMTSQRRQIVDEGGPVAEGGTRLQAVYTRPYQMHASIGPSCAVALMNDDGLLVWSHTQGVYPDRAAIAEMLGMEENSVRVIHMEGSGCYGHNGADDAAADAALIAHAMPGRPIRLQWMREQEHAWEPYGSAMIMEAAAKLGEDGLVEAWNYEVWSSPHSTRPGGAQYLLPAWTIENPYTPTAPNPIPQPAGGGTRNAVPLYDFPNQQVVHHFIPEMPLRCSALRGLGAYGNVFALESFVDELAHAAQIDPVEFRLRQLSDERARDVISLAAERFGWSQEALPPGRGRGFAFAKYKNLACWCAVALDLSVEPETGAVRLHRAVAATDSGQIVNPDGIRNQIEGGILQSASWTLFEEVAFTQEGVTSRDWGTYPIMRFPSVFESVEVHPIDRPGERFLGTGEASQGPTSAAIANAIFDATGVRLRDLPFTRARIKAAIGV